MRESDAYYSLFNVLRRISLVTFLNYMHDALVNFLLASLVAEVMSDSHATLLSIITF